MNPCARPQVDRAVVVRITGATALHALRHRTSSKDVQEDVRHARIAEIITLRRITETTEDVRQLHRQCTRCRLATVRVEDVRDRLIAEELVGQLQRPDIFPLVNERQHERREGTDHPTPLIIFEHVMEHAVLDRLRILHRKAFIGVFDRTDAFFARLGLAHVRTCLLELLLLPRFRRFHLRLDFSAFLLDDGRELLRLERLVDFLAMPEMFQQGDQIARLLF